jgi:predicted Zn-dependent protease with MMP-like domain
VAKDEVNAIIFALASEIRMEAESLPVTYDRRHNEDLRRLDLHETLGLFVGNSLQETGSESDPIPAQIILFLENIWRFANREEATYRREVRTTFLHELGHFLGLGEGDLEDRGL